MGTEANGAFAGPLCSVQCAHALHFWKLHTAAYIPAPRLQVGESEARGVESVSQEHGASKCQKPDFEPPSASPQALPLTAWKGPGGFPGMGWGVGVGRPFWKKTSPDAHGGLCRCQAHSRGRGMGVAGRRLTCFPTEGFGICRLCPGQELRIESHIAWSLLCPQSGDTETRVKSGDRWPAWW